MPEVKLMNEFSIHKPIESHVRLRFPLKTIIILHYHSILSPSDQHTNPINSQSKTQWKKSVIQKPDYETLNQNVKANAKYFVSVVVFRIFFVDED